jgi:hypothetical protein
MGHRGGASFNPRAFILTNLVAPIRRFLSFYYTHIGKNNDPHPWAGPILTQGLLFEKTW